MDDRKIKQIRIDKLRVFYAYLLVFVFLYNPPIYGHMFIKFVYILSLANFILTRQHFSTDILKLFGLALILISYSLVNSLLHSSTDFNMLGIWRLFIGMFVAHYVFYNLERSGVRIDKYTPLKLLAYTAVPQYFIIVLSYVIPPFKEFFLTFLGANAISFDVLKIYAVTRGVGWTFGQFAGFAVILGMSLLCHVCLWISKKGGNDVLKFIILLFAIIGGSLCARTFMLILFIILCYWAYIRIRNNELYKIIKSLSFVVIFLIITIPIIIKIGSDYFTEDTLNWLFEFYYNYEETGSFESKSTDQLTGEMWGLPNSISTWIFGDGRFINQSGSHPMYSESDAGLICSLWGWGVIGTVLYYFIIYKSFDIPSHYTKDDKIKKLLTFLFIIIMIYNVKGIETGFPIACILMRGLFLAKNQRGVT